jgi:hypothetical protein
MLNPECVNYSRGKVKIVFTDDAVDHALTVYLIEDDGFRLAQMLLDKTNLPARQKRRLRHDPFDITF